MQNKKEILNKIKKALSVGKFAQVFIISFFSVAVIMAVGLAFVWYYRAGVFDFFAKEYLKEIKDNSSAGSADSNPRESTDKKNIFTQDSFIVDTVKKANPAVVSITISKNIPKYELYTDPNQGNNQNPFGNIFPGFFFNIPQYRQNGIEKKEVGGGSGFFVAKDGLIVTNRHVVEDKEAEYTVFTNNGKKHPAKVVARDPVLDIALIKITPAPGESFPYLPLGNSDTLDVGQSVIAIGNALGEFRNTVSVGVVSGLSRSITAGDPYGNSEVLDRVIQTDAAINPGNSGGPLLDLSGYVIGVNVAVAQGSQNIGFALPINSVKSAVESVKNTGKIIRPFLGVRYVSVNAEMKDKNNLSVDYGVLVKAGQKQNELAVIPGSPANKAGIVENDIILEVDGVKIDEKTSLASIIRQKNVGDTITLKILSKGAEKIVKATLEAAKDSQ